MAVYRPTYKDPKTGKTRQSHVWWYDFIYSGKRVRESAKTTRKTIATEAEKRRRLDLEKALAGIPVEKRHSRINSVADYVRPYLKRYEIDHHGRTQSILFAKGRSAHILRLLGNTLLPDLTEDTVRIYIGTRLQERASGRTINMELGELSRAIGKPWSVLWPKLRKQEERKDIGKALSGEQEARLLEYASSSRSPLLGTVVRIALLTGMRSGEITGLKWEQIDLVKRVLTVGRAKTSSGTGRQIPMNDSLFQVLSDHSKWFTRMFGKIRPEYYLFPFGKPTPSDPTRPTTTVKTAWGTLRKQSGGQCRLHDLRHTAATKMAEPGVPESTMLALMGHLSRAMMERYSHIRMAAKREAVGSLESKRTKPD